MSKIKDAELLDKNELLAWAKTTDYYENKVQERIGYIIGNICKTFNIPEDEISWGYTEERDVSTKEIVEDDFMDFCIHFDTSVSLANIIDKEGKKYNLLYNGVPKRWLWESFEKELEDGAKLYVEKEQKNKLDKKEKAKIRKTQKQQALEEIKNKLTKEELKLVKIKK